MAEIMESERFIPAVDFVYRDGNMYVTKRVTDHFKKLGIPGAEEYDSDAETLEGIALERPFLHPLCETMPGPGEQLLNSWACVSVMINCAQMWGNKKDLPKDRGREARKNLKMFIATENPTLDVDYLLKLARWNDNALLQLANTAAAGFDKFVQQAVKDGRGRSI
ncbi:MAG: hypothetical protein WCD18_00660 [Thermosynechococcaceae cyanobacterium]